MTIDKYVSSKSIIEAVYRDTGISYELPYSDCINWIYTVMEFIGSPAQYIPKIRGIAGDSGYDFENYKIKLPCDFHRLSMISVDGVPVRSKTSEFHHLMDGVCCGLSTPGSSSFDVFTDAFGNVFNSNLGVTDNWRFHTGVTFDINNDFITFNVKSGRACLAYMAFPVDDEGFPMIPDNAKYVEAVTRYLIMKLDYIGWRTNQVSKDVYMDAKQEYEWYVGSITNELKIPDLNQMESLKNALVRLKPNHQEYSSFFSSLGSNRGHRN